jgi:hypothetical protein
MERWKKSERVCLFRGISRKDLGYLLVAELPALILNERRLIDHGQE